MELRVGDVARAAAVLREHGVESTHVDDRLLLAIEESDAPPLIAAIASAGIPIYHAQRHVQTLEEMFIEATGGETVG